VPGEDVTGPDTGDDCRLDDGMCSTCNSGCGYCASTNQCVAGSETGPATGSCARWIGNFNYCGDYDLTMGGCLRCYPDADGDGFPSMTMTACVATADCPAGLMRRRSDRRFDCADGDRNAFPGQTAYFDRPVTGTTSSLAYDYNCDGVQTRHHSVQLIFCSSAGGICTNNGWSSSTIPLCGVEAPFKQCDGPPGCSARETRRIQPCR